MLPELNANQYRYLERVITEQVIGKKEDLQSLLKAGRRNEYKVAYYINQRIEEQTKRLKELFND